MLAGVADELGWRVKTHGLGIQDGCKENIRVMAFHPGRRIGDQREARRVRFGKAIAAEALELLEGALGEVAAVAIIEHAGDQLVLKRMDAAGMLESRHG